jgi:uncharacterized protein (DUF58 family)
MLTARGFWLFISVVALLGAGIATASTPTVLVCLTVLLWFLAHWCLFQWRCRTMLGRLAVHRSLITTRGEVVSIWAGQRALVRVVLTCDAAAALPFVLVADRVPATARWLAGVTQAEGALAAGMPLELSYAIECPGAGKIRFDGVRAQLADVHGFFYQTHFVRDVRHYRVLPALPLDPAHSTFVKTHNTLPLLGTHRHPRPGSGSELFDLREYMPGDPPRMIAWKVSARRDRLMTRELESEVPIRCTLFVDVSSSVRVGPAGRTALCRLVAVAAGVAQANTGERDLTGLSLFDETAVTRTMRPSRGTRHLWQLIDELTEAAALMPNVKETVLYDLLPYAYGLAQDVYPDLLRSDVNRIPWWLPFWAPQPLYAMARPPLPKKVRSGMQGWLLRPMLGAARWLRHQFWPRHPLRTSYLRPAYHRAYRWRKQLAAILSARYDLGPGGLALLLEDDDAHGRYLQRFLAEHQVAHPYPLYDGEGRYLFRAPAKFGVLADALLAAVTRGKDNELFVLLADLLEGGGPELARLERAICLARARHHQVLVICPWPTAVPPPMRNAPQRSVSPKPTWSLEDIVLRASTMRLQQAFGDLQHVFARLGVPVLCAADDDTVDLILYRMQRLRVRERGVR